MIDIKRFREWLLELKEAVNRKTGEESIASIAMAVHEGHLMRKLRDRKGIALCARYPDAKVSGAEDALGTQNQVLLFIVEKVPSGQHSEEEEIGHYATMQALMNAMVAHLTEGNLLCDDSIRITSGLNVEWEWDIFGGWNGISISFTFEDFYNFDEP